MHHHFITTIYAWEDIYLVTSTLVPQNLLSFFLLIMAKYTKFWSRKWQKFFIYIWDVSPQKITNWIHFFNNTHVQNLF